MAADGQAESIKQDSFSIKKKPYNVRWTETHFEWQEENAQNKAETSVRIRDIITIRRDAKPETGDSASQFTVVYVKQQKNFVLKRHEVTFTGDAVKCDTMCREVQSSLAAVTDRPRKLLVLINPVSGRSKGADVYKSKVAPIFEEANIETDVIVTEKAHHTEEILATHDLTSIHGVIIVGGDGMYHEYSNGLIRRMAADAGHDGDSPDYVPPEFPVPVGLIPCGTGNAIAGYTYGSYDFATAAYSAVLGYRCKNNIFGVYSEDKLVAYYTFQCAYGLWGDMIYAAENRRNQGIMRYPIAILGTLLFKQHRRLNLSIQYRCRADVDVMNQDRMSAYFQPQGTVASSDKQDTDPEASSSSDMKKAETTDAESAEDVAKSEEVVDTDKVSVNLGNEMKTLNGTFTSLCSSFTCGAESFKDCTIDKRMENVKDVMFTYFTSSGTTMEFLKGMYQYAFKPSEMISTGRWPLLLANEWNVTLNNPSDPESENGRMELILNIDGEVFNLKKPEFHVKMFEERIPLYCNLPKITGRPKK